MQEYPNLQGRSFGAAATTYPPHLFQLEMSFHPPSSPWEACGSGKVELLKFVTAAISSCKDSRCGMAASDYNFIAGIVNDKALHLMCIQRHTVDSFWIFHVHSLKWAHSMQLLSLLNLLWFRARIMCVSHNINQKVTCWIVSLEILQLLNLKEWSVS